MSSKKRRQDLLGIKPSLGRLSRLVILGALWSGPMFPIAD
jgi:hypothetical protein